MVRSYFSYVPMGLSVRFLNLSSGNPISFLWDFGKINLVETPLVPAIPGLPATIMGTTVGNDNDQLSSTYFVISSPSSTYYVWFNVQGISTDPEVPGMTGIEIPLSEGVEYSDSDIVNLLVSTINPLGIFTVDHLVIPGVFNAFLITLTVSGIVESPDGGTSGFNITLLSQGTEDTPEIPSQSGYETLTSTDAEPIVTFPWAGVFPVSLTISDGTTSDTLILPVGVSSMYTDPALPTLILDAIQSRLPSTLLPDIPITDGMIKKWQMYLAILVDPNIPTQDTFDQTKWPSLVNDLIINLCLYDVITDKVLAAAASSAVASGTGSGGLKKVVTGPAEAEWFSSAESAYSMMKAGGLYEQIKQRICILSNRLRVPLEFCKGPAWIVRAPTIYDPLPQRIADYDASRNNEYESSLTNPLNIHD